MRPRRIVSFLVFLVSWWPAGAALLAADSTAIPIDDTILRGKLECGVSYYIQHNSRPEKRIELRLAIRAGSVLEDDDQQGLAHLIEHLAFRGTSHFPNGALLSFMQSVGSDFGPHLNGTTNFDETLYKLSLPSDPKETLEKGLLILRDWATDIDFSSEQVAKERQVVIEEWRLGLGAKQRLLQQALPTLLKDSRFADRLPIGKKEIVESASIDTIKRFYKDWYQPANLTLVVVGEVNPKEIEAQLVRLFSDLPRPSNIRPRPDFLVPAGKTWSFTVAADPEFGFQVARILYPHQKTLMETVADFHAAALRQIALGTFAARLSEARNRDPVPFQTADISYGSMATSAREETALFALLSEGGAERGVTVLLEEAERARKWGVTASEFAREKLNWLKKVENGYLERDKRESDVLADRCIAHALHGDLLASPEWVNHQSQAIAQAVTLEEVSSTLQGLLTSPGPIIWLSLPRKTGVVLPTPDALEKIVAGVSARKIDRYIDTAVIKPLLDAMPQPGKIISQEEQSSIGLTEYQLGNGVRVVLKPSDFKKDEVLLSAFRPGGLSRLPLELDLAGKCILGYIPEAGLGSLNKLEIERALTGKKAGWTALPDLNFDQIKGQSAAADLETLLQLIYLSFTEPRRDQAAYARMLAANQTFETSIALNPAASFLNDVLGLRYADHPRALRLIQSPDAWKALSLDKLLQAYRLQFGSARGYTFVICGSFTIDQIKPLIERYLASLPSTAIDTEIKDLGIRQVAGPLSKTIERGGDPKAIIVTLDETASKWSLPEVHRAWSLGNILQRSLLDRVRVEQGNSYTLQVASRLEKFPYERYNLEIMVPCAPETVKDVLSTIKTEVTRLRTKGPTTPEIEKEVESQRAAIDLRARSNNDWLWQLELIYKYDEGLGRLTHPGAMIPWVTAEALQATAQRLWSTDRWLEYILQPAPPAPIK